jgi:hypothetical protein
MGEHFQGDGRDGVEPGGLPESGRFDELEELRRDIERRIRDNQRFLERFMEEDYVDEDEIPEEPPEEEEL